MAFRDQYTLSPTVITAEALRLSDAQVGLMIMATCGIVGGVAVGALVTMILGSLSGIQWAAIIGIQASAAVFLGGAIRATDT